MALRTMKNKKNKPDLNPVTAHLLKLKMYLIESIIQCIMHYKLCSTECRPKQSQQHESHRHNLIIILSGMAVRKQEC